MATTAVVKAATPATAPGATATPLFTSVGCNRDPNAVDWLIARNLIAYGAGRLITIYSPAGAAVTATFRGHRGVVNAVKFLPDDDTGDLEVVSGGTDKNLIVWRYNPLTHQYTVAATLTGHKEAVAAVDVIRVPNGSLCMVSASTDGTIRIWSRASAAGSTWECPQTLALGGSRIMMTVALSIHRDAQGPLVVLAMAGVDCRVHIYLAHPDTGAFSSLLPLEGHQDWIRSLSFCTTEQGLLLASASQDKTIRLWKISAVTDQSVLTSSITKAIGETKSATPAAAATSAAGPTKTATGAAEVDMSVSTTSFGQYGHVVRYSGHHITVVLDALLAGHDDWVLSARFPAPTVVNGVTKQTLALLSASVDKTMVLWRPDPSSSVWLTEVRVGELGGHTYGFYGAHFGPSMQTILAHGYTGCFHLWQTADPNASDAIWNPTVAVSGHSSAVMDLTWDSSNTYLLSTSLDQTTRLWAPWTQPADQKDIVHPRWFEIARPQVHGYDLSCIVAVPGRRHMFASGADEKVVRVFYAPVPFLQTLSAISGVTEDSKDEEKRLMKAKKAKLIKTLASEKKKASGDGDTKDAAAGAPGGKDDNKKAGTVKLAKGTAGTKRALKAMVPELGLSNKATHSGEETHIRASGMVSNDARMITVVMDESKVKHSAAPPVEDVLIDSTLWPEVEKIYGHGYEIVSVAINSTGTLLASACSAKKPHHAVIRVFETKEWTEVFQLPSHKSTVVQMEFSHDDQYLVSVSRDRQYSLFQYRDPATAATAVAAIDSTSTPSSAATSSTTTNTSAPATSAAAANPAVIAATPAAAATLSVPSSGATSLSQSSRAASYHLISRLKAHSRIIWTCTWAADDSFFVTGARDKKVKVWRPAVDGEKLLKSKSSGGWTRATVLPTFESSITALAFAPTAAKSQHVLSVGLEDGRLQLWSGITKAGSQGKAPTFKWNPLLVVDPSICHAETVRRIRWRIPPQHEEGDKKKDEGVFQMATCSRDGSVRLFRINLADVTAAAKPVKAVTSAAAAPSTSTPAAAVKA